MSENMVGKDMRKQKNMEAVEMKIKMVELGRKHDKWEKW